MVIIETAYFEKHRPDYLTRNELRQLKQTIQAIDP